MKLQCFWSIAVVGGVLLAGYVQGGESFDRAAAVRRLQAQLKSYDDHKERSYVLNMRARAGEDVQAELTALGKQPHLSGLKDDALKIVDVDGSDAAALDAIRVALITHSAEEARLHARMSQLALKHHMQRPGALKALGRVRLHEPQRREFWEKVYAACTDPAMCGNAAAQLMTGYFDQLNTAALRDQQRSDLRQKAATYAQVIRKDYPQVPIELTIFDIPKSLGAYPLLTALAAYREKVLAHSVGSVLPMIEVPTLEGVPDSLGNYRGKVVLLDFWATWCMPCVQDHPDLIAFKQEMAGRPFEIIGISSDEDVVKVKKYLREKRALPWVNWFTGKQSKLSADWGVNRIPTYLVVDANGMVRERTHHFGAESKDLVRRLVAKLVNE